MRFIRYLGLLLTLAGCQYLLKVETAPADPGRSTVKIQAVAAGGKQNLGSGVVIAPDTIATNCHVMRHAKRAFVIQPEQLYPVLAEAALPAYDVCLLKTENLSLPPAELADTDDLNTGDDIVLSGYPFALGLRMKHGNITGLHPFQSDRIIEINAGFNHGASGGGVFDQDGKLIGLMTFMGREAGAIHFYAIPSTWLTMGLDQEFMPLRPFADKSFWEKGEFGKQIRPNNW